MIEFHALVDCFCNSYFLYFKYFYEKYFVF